MNNLSTRNKFNLINLKKSPGEWIEIGNLISPREGHSSFVRGDFIISCGGQNRAKLLITCEAININGKKIISQLNHIKNNFGNLNFLDL